MPLGAGKEFEMRKLFLVAIAALALAAVALPAAALASPPGNDNFANATAISSLPFSDSVDVSAATTEENEPQACSYMPQTVWYAVAPAADGQLHVDPAGSSLAYGAQVNVYRADVPEITGLTFLNCATFSNRLDVDVRAGQTYYIQAGPTYGSNGTLTLKVSESVAPTNDDFDNATVIESLPFSDTVDTTLGTLAADDPRTPCWSPPLSTVWYSYTPSQSMPVGFDTSGSVANSSITVYTGERGALTFVGCGWNAFGFHALAGVTYHIMVTNDIYGGTGVMQFHARQGPTVTGLTINRTATVNNASGVATISGTISCDLNASATVSGTLRQKLNRYTVITGSYSMTTPCTPSGNGWSAQVIGNNGPFGGGQAGADATGTACLDPDGYGGGLVCTPLSASQTVTLKGGH
jgi:hypothetical protein